MFFKELKYALCSVQWIFCLVLSILFCSRVIFAGEWYSYVRPMTLEKFIYVNLLEDAKNNTILVSKYSAQFQRERCTKETKDSILSLLREMGADTDNIEYDKLYSIEPEITREDLVKGLDAIQDSLNMQHDIFIRSMYVYDLEFQYRNYIESAVGIYCSSEKEYNRLCKSAGYKTKDEYVVENEKEVSAADSITRELWEQSHQMISLSNDLFDESVQGSTYLENHARAFSFFLVILLSVCTVCMNVFCFEQEDRWEVSEYLYSASIGSREYILTKLAARFLPIMLLFGGICLGETIYYGRASLRFGFGADRIAFFQMGAFYVLPSLVFCMCLSFLIELSGKRGIVTLLLSMGLLFLIRPVFIVRFPSLNQTKYLAEHGQNILLGRGCLVVSAVFFILVATKIYENRREGKRCFLSGKLKERFGSDKAWFRINEPVNDDENIEEKRVLVEKPRTYGFYILQDIRKQFLWTAFLCFMAAILFLIVFKKSWNNIARGTGELMLPAAAIFLFLSVSNLERDYGIYGMAALKQHSVVATKLWRLLFCCMTGGLCTGLFYLAGIMSGRIGTYPGNLSLISVNSIHYWEGIAIFAGFLMVGCVSLFISEVSKSTRAGFFGGGMFYIFYWNVLQHIYERQLSAPVYDMISYRKIMVLIGLGWLAAYIVLIFYEQYGKIRDGE